MGLSIVTQTQQVHNSITRRAIGRGKEEPSAFHLPFSSPLSSSRVPFPMGSITDVEVEVAEILRNLPNLIQRFKSNRRRRTRCCRLVWTVKKRRSAISPTVRTKIDKVRSSSSCCAPASPSQMETDVVPKAKAAALSPASPLCFDLSGGEEAFMDTGVNSVSSSPCSHPYKNGKVQDREWIEEKKSSIYVLLEENKNLHQEAADIRNRFKSLIAENSQLKEIKSNWKTTTGQKRPVSQEEGELEQNNTLPSLVVPDCPTISQIGRESMTVVRAQSQHETPISSTLPFHYKNQISPIPQQLWNLSGFSGVSSGNSIVRLPDLNACVDDNGFAVTEQQRQRPPLDSWKMATAEARKKRIKINRRKAAMGTIGGGPFRRENRVGVAKR